MHKGDPDPSQYRAVFQLVQDDKHPDLFYELSYGHMNDIHVAPGDYLKAGDVIGTVGNTGPVYHNGVAVTKEARLAGSHDGAHLHGPQVRACRRVSVTAPSSHLLSDGFGVYRDADGCYYEVLDYTNGFNGCSDPSLYFNGILAQNAPQLRALKTKLAAAMRQLVQLLTSKLSILMGSRSAPPTPTQIS
jgi:murein DD-endopeptidase MepM/ murein hydrolase activator NlpD